LAQKVLPTYFIGSILLRIARVHHWSRKRSAHIDSIIIEAVLMWTIVGYLWLEGNQPKCKGF
jgi:hypothetical protein